MTHRADAEKSPGRSAPDEHRRSALVTIAGIELVVLALIGSLVGFLLLLASAAHEDGGIGVPWGVPSILLAVLAGWAAVHTLRDEPRGKLAGLYAWCFVGLLVVRIGIGVWAMPNGGQGTAIELVGFYLLIGPLPLLRSLWADRREGRKETRDDEP